MARSNARQRAERERGGVGFAAGKDDFGVASRSDCGELTNQATLAQPWSTDNPDEAASISVEHVSQPAQLGVTAQHQAFVAAHDHPAGLHGEQPPCGHGQRRRP